jgi:hypothetical protein
MRRPALGTAEPKRPRPTARPKSRTRGGHRSMLRNVTSGSIRSAIERSIIASATAASSMTYCPSLTSC